MVKKKSPDQKTTIYLNGRFVGQHSDGVNLAKRLRENEDLMN